MYLFPVWPQSTRLLLLVLLVCLVDLEQVTNPSLLGLSPQALTCDRALCFPISSSLGDDILSVTLQTVAHSSSALGWAAQLDLSAPAPPLQDWGQGAMLSSLSYHRGMLALSGEWAYCNQEWVYLREPFRDLCCPFLARERPQTKEGSTPKTEASRRGLQNSTWK